MEELAKLDFLLAEMRRWWEAGRIPPALLQPLYAEYAARRAALVVPRRSEAALEDYDLTEETPASTWNLLAFLEKHNIAALHLVGAALLFVGLIALVQWQWSSWGRLLLPILLAGAAAGLMLGGDRLHNSEPQSGRVLALLGTAVVPLSVVAFQVLRLSEGLLTWESACALASGIGAAISAWRWLRTKDTLLLPVFFAEAATLIGAAAPGFPVRESGWLALAVIALLLVRLQETKDTREVLGGSAIVLTALALVGSFLHGVALWSSGIVLLGGAATLGLIAVVLRTGWLGYGASAFAMLGMVWLAPDGFDSEAALLAGAGLILAGIAAWHRRTGIGEAAPYRYSSLVAPLISFPMVAFAPEFTHYVSPLWGIALGVTALLWVVLARLEKSDDKYALYAALGVGLLAMRYAAIPVDAAFVAVTHLAPCPERWLLIVALILGLFPENASHRIAVGALAWSCAFQVPLLDTPEGQAALILAAVGTALWSGLTRSAVGACLALVPLTMAALVQWGVRGLSHSGSWILPAWVLAGGFGACGLMWRHKALVAAVLWSMAAAQLAAAFLPVSLLDYWPLAILPVFLWLGMQTDDDSSAFLGVATCAVFYVISAPASLALSVVGGVLALSVLGLGLYKERRISVGIGGGLATTTLLLLAEGTMAYHGFLAALIAVVWQGLAAALRHGSEWRWRSFSMLGLLVSGVSAVLALAGAIEEYQGRWAVFALTLVAAELSGAAGLRRELACLHAAFTAALTAFGLYLFDRIGFGPDRLDWFLLPLGIYLLLIAEVRKQSVLRLPGVLFLLVPSLLAAWLTPDLWSHSILLTAECLAFIVAGIGRHTRAYLGGGVLFLVTLLLVRLWEPLKEVNYGVYLTLLGVSVLASAIAFERRREALLSWAQSVKDRYDHWD